MIARLSSRPWARIAVRAFAVTSSFVPELTLSFNGKQILRILSHFGDLSPDLKLSITSSILFRPILMQPAGCSIFIQETPHIIFPKLRQEMYDNPSACLWLPATFSVNDLRPDWESVNPLPVNQSQLLPVPLDKNRFCSSKTCLCLCSTVKLLPSHQSPYLIGMVRRAANHV